MGTRHMQRIINKAGEVKVDQYGQWDGYPSGQGVDILKFLRKADLDKFNDLVSKLRDATQDDLDVANEFCTEVTSKKGLSYSEVDVILKANLDYYCLSRDCGSDLFDLIYSDKLKFVNVDDGDGYSFTEWNYEVNLKDNTFRVTGHGYDKKYSLDKLPTKAKFLKDFGEDS